MFTGAAFAAASGSRPTKVRCSSASVHPAPARSPMPSEAKSNCCFGAIKRNRIIFYGVLALLFFV
jgi:hypothetical protein